jgi:hypothetical protein
MLEPLVQDDVAPIEPSSWNFANSKETGIGLSVALIDFLRIEGMRLSALGIPFDRMEARRCIGSLLESADMLSADLKNPSPEKVLQSLLQIEAVRMLWKSNASIRRGVWSALENHFGVVPWKN